jgi:hypothetical protein
MATETIRTFETRNQIDQATDQTLHDCAKLFAHVGHRLFADIASGKTPGELKNDYLACYEITARHFNALRVQIEGKIASIKKRRPTLIAELKERIESLKTKIKKQIKAKFAPNVIHQKKRRLNRLESKFQQLYRSDLKNRLSASAKANAVRAIANGLILTI